MFSTLLIAQPAAETTPGATAAAGIITGQISEGEMPISGARITVFTASRMINGSIVFSKERKVLSTESDSAGRYQLSGVPLGPSVVNITAPGATFESKAAYVVPAPKTTEVSFHLLARAAIQGRVLDQEKVGVAGAPVYLVAQEYVGGVLRNTIKAVETTDANGSFTVRAITPLRSFRLFVQPVVPTSANLPKSEKKDASSRAQALTAAWFPGTPYVGSAIPVVLQPGETREGLSIELRRVPTYCISATVVANIANDRKITATVENLDATTGGGMMMKQNEHAVPTNGLLQMCGLTPGNYRLSARTEQQNGGPGPLFGSADVTIVDEDIDKLQVRVDPPVELAVETDWEPPAPEEPIDARVAVRIHPLKRASIPGENPFLTLTVPSGGTMSLPLDTYAVTAETPSRGLYIKDIVYGQQSVLSENLVLGGQLGNPSVRVILGRKAGSVHVQVADKKGGAVSGSRVVLFSADAATDHALARSMSVGFTDERGLWSCTSLAPGTYYVLSTASEVDGSPEGIAKLRQAARASATKIIVDTGKQQDVTIHPTDL